MKRLLWATVMISLFLVPFLATNPAYAENRGCTEPNCPAEEPAQAPQGETIVLPNPLGNQSDPQIIIGLVIRVILGIVGSVALVFFIYGGLMMMTSAGNSDRVTKGRNTLVWAAIGLMVIFSSYTLVGFILKSVPQ